MALFDFRQKTGAGTRPGPTQRSCRLHLGLFDRGDARTAAQIEDFRALLPAGTRALYRPYRRHAQSRQVSTAKRSLRGGLRRSLPHMPARSHLRFGHARRLDRPLPRERPA